MSKVMTRQLVRYRSIFVAIANAAVTWVILIIAPLGLFSVITCTALVFVASLLNGWMGDRALLSLLAASDRDAVVSTSQGTPLSAPDSPSVGDRAIGEPERNKELPRE
ncbi:CRISPR-associated protein Csx18 [Oxynema aestuarii]|jgi:hypothetical protein|uniref:Uncharacterized protein n=1 Tax=Oxynema aestuarii AP17 TaxID=2064643 RepID=A0A6H1U3I2_9CYAN|nr:CRISPR-associated protein Csx18 [Oxynema aestuarii]QIZ72179.1 hypothetical protein HCG48_17700 [Oxynema aestuarii AP17]RMH77417.1 MAG: hypothetical protein D6680_05165 [Cyanobacteria bacterium J007]